MRYSNNRSSSRARASRQLQALGEHWDLLDSPGFSRIPGVHPGVPEGCSGVPQRGGSSDTQTNTWVLGWRLFQVFLKPKSSSGERDCPTRSRSDPQNSNPVIWDALFSLKSLSCCFSTPKGDFCTPPGLGGGFSMKKKSCPIPGSVPGWGLEQPLEAGIRWILRSFPPKPVWDPVEQREDFQLEQLCYKNIGKGRCKPCCSCREFSRSICSREIPKEKQGELFPSMRKKPHSGFGLSLDAIP